MAEEIKELETKEEHKLTIAEQSDKLLDALTNEQDIEKAKDIISLFNLNIAKKNALRVNKLNGLLDKIDDQALARFSEHPDEVSNKDLVSYMTAVQNQADKALEQVKSVKELPQIQLNNQVVNVGIADENKVNLSPESRRRIVAAVQAMLAEARKAADFDDNTIDAEVTPINEQEGEEINE